MFTLPQLSYQYDAFGQYISRDIMELHHSKHHQTYVDKLNVALSGHEELADKTLLVLIKDLDTLPKDIQTAVRNHGGGHYNHSMFWQMMSPAGGGEPGGDFGLTLANQFGDFQTFTNNFSTAALSVFGSGWAWLMPDMSIITTQNQDNPVMQGLSEPVLGLDVWEHAYYLDYKSQRADYIKAWWNTVDWSYVAQRYSQSRIA